MEPRQFQKLETCPSALLQTTDSIQQTSVKANPIHSSDSAPAAISFWENISHGMKSAYLPKGQAIGSKINKRKTSQCGFSPVLKGKYFFMNQHDQWPVG
jgi:hypothetical protein